MGSPGVEGPPMIPEDPHVYVVAIFQSPPSPDYVPGLEEPETMSYQLRISHCLLLPHLLLSYRDIFLSLIQKKDDEEDPSDYPTDRGDDGDDEESSNDDVEEDEEDEDEEEEEEHLAPADPVAVAFLALSPFLSKEDAKRFLALPTPPLSPLSPYSSSLPHIPSPPLPIPSPPPNSPTYIEAPLGFRAARIRQRDTPPSPVHETEILKICLPLCKRSCRTAPTPRYEVGESLAAGADRQDRPAVAGADLYGFVDMVDAAPGCLTSSELGYEDGIMYSLLEDVREDWSLLRGRVNMLFRDRPYHRRTALLMEEEARVSRVAWVQSMDASNKTRSEAMLLQTTIIAQQSEITELRAADRKRQAAIIEMLVADRQRQK
ncbi:hypothetical protein Tco_1259716, partial [Tanacetum coccineum]